MRVRLSVVAALAMTVLGCAACAADETVRGPGGEVYLVPSGFVCGQSMVEPSRLVVTYGAAGQELEATTEALRAWRLADAPLVAYSVRGSGGFENEGQNLHVAGATTTGSVTRQVYAGMWMIEDVTSARLEDGRVVVILGMADGGLGSPHLAVTDAWTGELLFEERMTSLSSLSRDGTLAVLKYDYNNLDPAGDPSVTEETRRLKRGVREE